MPKVKRGNKYKKIYTEEKIQEAINAIDRGMSQYKASLKFGIPMSTLQFRLSGNFVKSTPGPSPILTTNEEDLVNWILECHRKGFPRRKENLQASVKKFLDIKARKTPFRDNIPGDGWYRAFLRRHPILTERQPEGVTNASSNVSKSDICKWFKGILRLFVREKLFGDTGRSIPDF